jgi:hypothetical protein
MKNRTGCRNGIVYEYLDDIPDEALLVKDYGKYEFEDLYFYENVFYQFNGINFRKLLINEIKMVIYMFGLEILIARTQKYFTQNSKKIMI